MKRRGNLLIVLGSLMVILALILWLASAAINFNADHQDKNDVYYRFGSLISDSGNKKIVNPNEAMPVIEIEGRKYCGIIEIPSLDLVCPVLVSGSEYDESKEMAALSGSIYLNDFIVIVSKERCDLDSLKVGSELFFTDGYGNVYDYTCVDISNKTVTANSDLSLEYSGGKGAHFSVFE